MLTIVGIILILFFMVGYLYDPCPSKDINCTKDCECKNGLCASANGVNQCCKYVVKNTDGKKYCL